MTARPLRLEYPDLLYHVTSRRNARQRIFHDDRDRGTSPELLGQVIKRFGWPCHGYCLMENHYHLLIETPLAAASKACGQMDVGGSPGQGRSEGQGEARSLDLPGLCGS
ncbi:MAG: hypothetical protein FJ279_08430 [Planctomycetes bacterium]|nr:hypothetical protein [Planctomycetota bacterium]